MGVDTAIMEDLQVGNVELKNEGLLVVNFGLVDRRPGPPVDGLLGFDVLQDFDVAFDLPHDLVTFYEPQSCASGQTPWAGDYDAEAFIPRPDRLNEPDIAINIDGKAITLLIDSGAGSTIITQHAVTASGLAPEALAEKTFRGVGVGNLAFSGRREQFANVTIGAEGFSDLWMRVGEMATTPDSPMQGLLGEDYLRHHRVFLANTARTADLSLTMP